MPRNRTWAKVWAGMSAQQRNELRIACKSQLKVPPSDLEVRVIRLLLSHREPFDFQVGIPSTRYHIDFQIRGKLWETFGCGYHQCPTCGNNWWPAVRFKDEDRRQRIESLGFKYDVIWNHESTLDIARRVFA